MHSHAVGGGEKERVKARRLKRGQESNINRAGVRFAISGSHEVRPIRRTVHPVNVGDPRVAVARSILVALQVAY